MALCEAKLRIASHNDGTVLFRVIAFIANATMKVTEHSDLKKCWGNYADKCP